MSRKPDTNESEIIELLKSDKDLPGLIKALRKPDNAHLRAQAARALGEIDDFKAVESLVRSTLDDPDASVREAAHAALVQLLGNNAEETISSYQAGPPQTDYWIEPMLAGDLLNAGVDTTGRELVAGQEEVETPWGQNDVRGLLSILQGNYPDEMRLRAIRALKTCNNVHAVDALAWVALWGEGERIRQAANEALEDLVGENLPQVLQSYQDSHPDQDDNNEDGNLFGDEEEDEAESDEDGEERPEENEVESQPLLSNFQNTPVLQEEKPLGGALLPILLVILVVVVVLFLLWRK